MHYPDMPKNLKEEIQMYGVRRIKEIRAEIVRLRADTEAKVAHLEAEIAAIRSEIEEDVHIANLEGELAEMRRRKAYRA